MKFTLSNHDDVCERPYVRLTIETDLESALEMVSTAMTIEDLHAQERTAEIFKNLKL